MSALVYTDEAMDDVHHALGRPKGPWTEPYRNFYTLGAADPRVPAFEASPLWGSGRPFNEGRDLAFGVTQAGKDALWQWLADKRRAKGMRRYFVTVDVDGHSGRADIIAKSRAAARYDYFLHLKDSGWCDEFAQFLRLKPRVVAA